MPKLVEVINDFSGGLAKGYSPENLQNNQMQKCDNLIADGIGKLSTVPNTETKSTSDIVNSLPVYNAKNIHSWSSDTTLTVQAQPNNVMTEPVVTKLQDAVRARWMMIMTRSSEYNSPSIRLVDLGRNDENVFYWSFPLIKGFENPEQALGKTLRGIDVNIHNDEINSNPDYMSIIPYKWNTHAEMDAILTGFTTTLGVAYQDVPTGEELFFYWQEGGTHPTYHNGDLKVSAVMDSNWNSSSSDSYGLRAMITFDYYGKLDLDLFTNGLDKRVATGSFNINFDNLSRTIDYQELMPDAQGNSNWAQAGDNVSEDKIMYTNMDSSNSDSFMWGQFSKWEYNLTGDAFNERATYSLNVELWTDAEHTTDIAISVFHENENGESSESIITALFNKLETAIGTSCPEQAIYYEWKEDGTGVEFFQDSRTEKAFGIKAVSAPKTDTVVITDIAPGEKFSNLVVCAGENTTANIYSLDSDNWLDYPLDLRIDQGVTYNTPLVFADTEGYLKISDQYFYNNSKPKWFGFLNLNEAVYNNNTFDVTGGFYIDDMSPTPFTETVSGGQLDGQYSHVFIANNLDIISNSRIFQLANSDANSCTVDVPFFSTSTPSASGLKLFVDWIDGEYSTYAKLDGSFTKKEDATWYYVYKYHGGAISQPALLHHGTHENVRIKSGNSPKADNVALGLSLSMGQYMINGNDSQINNVRLKGIEIYGYFPEYDSNNIYLALEIDLIRGWKSENTGDWQNLHSITNNNNVLNCYSTCKDGTFSISELPIFKTHPLISFYSKYKISWNKPIGFDTGGTGFRTSCVFNRMSYYGNVRIKNEDGSITYYPDGIIKSVKGYYDAVSVDNLIEATVNDGDEITCLRVAGNKLLQFKKKSLTIMGVKVLENGQSREVIEQTIDYCGVSGSNQVTETPYGVFWITRSGIYVFDGNRLEKLTENLKGSTISKTEWENFYGSRTHIGYDAYWNQVHICQDTQDNPKTLIYSFNTRAFTESNKLYASNHKTGFVNDSEGHLLWGQIGTGSNSVTTNSDNSPNFKDRTREALSDEDMMNQEQTNVG